MSLVVGEWFYTGGDWVVGSTEARLLLHFFTITWFDESSGRVMVLHTRGLGSRRN